MKNQIVKISISFLAICSLISPVSVFADGPSAGSDGATNITDTSATLNGHFSINSENATIDSWFEYASHDFKHSDSHTEVAHADRSRGPFSYTILGLYPGTTYYYQTCIVRTAIRYCSGTISFTTLPAITAPTSVMASANNIAGKNAQLVGSWSSNGTSTSVWFEYGETSSLGSRSYTQNHGGAGSAYQMIGNLKLDTTYYYKFAAQNKAGTVFSSIQNFKTLPTQPVSGGTGYTPTTSIDTLGAINITDTSATLQGIGKADAKEFTTAYFRYATMYPPPVFCNDLYGSQMSSTEDLALGTDTTGVPQVFSQNVIGLSPDTKYYYCALASSRSGISYSPHVYFFFTKPCPNCTSVTTNPATNVKKDGATLNGQFNTDNSVQTWFEYAKTLSALTSGNGAKVGIQSQAPGSYGDISAGLPGLSPNTTYRYRAVAKKSNGQLVYDNSTIKTFKTKSGSDINPCPTGGGGGPNNPTSIANNIAVAKTAGAPIAISPSISPIFGPIGSLPVGPIHIGGSSTPINSSQSSSASNCKPIMATTTATNVGNTSGTINGTWNANSLATTTWFDWGTSPSLGQSTAHVAQGLGTGFMAENLTGLSNGTTYYFRAVGQNAAGSVIGQTFSFTAGSGPNPPGGGGIIPSGPTTLTTPTPAIAPDDAIVRFREGVEHVFARQIIKNPAIATLFGYTAGADLNQYAYYLSHILAQIYGYVENGHEIRVSIPDIAAYELKLSNGTLTINEYFAGFLVSSRQVSPFKAPPAGYEYQFIKR